MELYMVLVADFPEVRLSGVFRTKEAAIEWGNEEMSSHGWCVVGPLPVAACEDPKKWGLEV